MIQASQLWPPGAQRPPKAEGINTITTAKYAYYYANFRNALRPNAAVLKRNYAWSIIFDMYLII
jgi:hypothetical protein